MVGSAGSRSLTAEHRLDSGLVASGSRTVL